MVFLLRFLLRLVIKMFFIKILRIYKRCDHDIVQIYVYVSSLLSFLIILKLINFKN